MQNPDRENFGEEVNAEAAEGGQIIESHLDFAEDAQSGGEEFGVDPPIIVDGGGKGQG